MAEFAGLSAHPSDAPVADTGKEPQEEPNSWAKLMPQVEQNGKKKLHLLFTIYSLT